jgi:DNA-3-methyladenine glycosylase
MKKLEESFYLRDNVLQVATDLLGKELVTNFNNSITSGIIAEVEAYAGAVDKASHAFGGRRTARTEVMFGKGGTSYVYLCYGIHHLFNVVSGPENVPHAVLIRALEPRQGTDIMLARTGKKQIDFTLTRGPGNVCKALGIGRMHTGISLQSDIIYITEGRVVDDFVTTRRIGVDYAREDALLPYRFSIASSGYVSGSRLQNQPLKES